MGILLPPVSQVTNTRINMTQHHRNRSLDSALQRIPEVSSSFFPINIHRCLLSNIDVVRWKWKCCRSTSRRRLNNNFYCRRLCQMCKHTSLTSSFVFIFAYRSKFHRPTPIRRTLFVQTQLCVTQQQTKQKIQSFHQQQNSPQPKIVQVKFLLSN